MNLYTKSEHKANTSLYKRVGQSKKNITTLGDHKNHKQTLLTDKDHIG